MLEDPQHDIRQYLDSSLMARSAAALSRACGISLAVYDLDTEVVWQQDGALDLARGVHKDPELARGFEDARRDASLTETKDVNGARAYIAPITPDQECVGFLFCQTDAAGATGDSVRPVRGLMDSYAQFLGEIVGGKRAIADLVNEVSVRYEELSLVYALSKALDLSLHEHEALDAICEATFDTLDADMLLMCVPTLGLKYVFPRGTDLPPECRDLCGALAARATAEQTSLAANNLWDDPELKDLAADYAHAAVAILTVDDDLGSLILLRSDREQRLYAGDIKLLDAVARLAAVDMTNRRISASRRRLFDASVFGLARLAESRDPETGMHLERVRVYTALMAEKLKEEEKFAGQIDDAFIEHIYRSSPLHDIGKVGVPDQILRKPGKLTAEEFETMKSHTVIGGGTLLDIEDRLGTTGDTFLTLGRQIAYSHHEKWDGSGYPHGLEGDDIPLAARIMALADVYDALTQKRCYKPAFPHEKARSIIVDDSGRHFDPDVVEAFLGLEGQFVDTREQLREPESENDTNGS